MKITFTIINQFTVSNKIQLILVFVKNCPAKVLELLPKD